MEYDMPDSTVFTERLLAVVFWTGRVYWVSFLLKTFRSTNYVIHGG